MDEQGLTFSTFLVDVGTLGAGGIILLIFVTSVTPTRRGFYCDDESIRYPFKSSTVPNYLLYIYGFVIPLLVIIITEFVKEQRNRRRVHFLIRPCPVWLLAIYQSLVNFLFGVAASQLVTDVGKYTIGRLRPNFIDVCKPNILDECQSEKYKFKYIVEYDCLGSPNDDASYSRVSFPSGHSSFSAYTMLYTAIFIQVKWSVQSGRPSRALRLAKHGVQIALILLAYFTALSRVMDNKHHWSDVLIGGLIGVISASLTAKYVAKFKPDRGDLYRVSSKEINGGRQQPGNNLGDQELGRQRTLDHILYIDDVESSMENGTPSSASALIVSSPQLIIN